MKTRLTSLMSITAIGAVLALAVAAPSLADPPDQNRRKHESDASDRKERSNHQNRLYRAAHGNNGNHRGWTKGRYNPHAYGGGGYRRPAGYAGYNSTYHRNSQSGIWRHGRPDAVRRNADPHRGDRMDAHQGGSR